MVMAHESTHVDQFLDETLIYDPRDNLTTRVELMPNHIEYTALKAKYGGYLPSNYGYVERKEKVRVLANGNGENGFQVTSQLLKVMAQYGYDATFGNVPKQPARVSTSKVSKKKNKHGRVGVRHR
jgi:hypothetical protein